MEVVVQTEYQDIYRIKHGVLLIVNKFVRADSNNSVRMFQPRNKLKLYHKNCQNLRELKEDYWPPYCPVELLKGTVLYRDYPVEATNDKTKWKYEIKTTDNCFSGDSIELLNYIKEIESVIR